MQHKVFIFFKYKKNMIQFGEIHVSNVSILSTENGCQTQHLRYSNS